MKTDTIEIIDNGRGPQLSTSRITVLDLVPYFQKKATYDEVIRRIPSLTQEEITVVEKYYREHQEELDEKDRRALQYRDEQVRLQRLRFPELNESWEERMARLRQLLIKRRQKRNGEGHPG